MRQPGLELGLSPPELGARGHRGWEDVEWTVDATVLVSKEGAEGTGGAASGFWRPLSLLATGPAGCWESRGDQDGQRSGEWLHEQLSEHGVR